MAFLVVVSRFSPARFFSSFSFPLNIALGLFFLPLDTLLINIISKHGWNGKNSLYLFLFAGVRGTVTKFFKTNIFRYVFPEKNIFRSIESS